MKKNFKNLDVDWYVLGMHERIKEAIRQSEAGECFSNEEVFEAIKQMLRKKKEEQDRPSH